MLKHIVLILFLVIQPMFAWAESNVDSPTNAEQNTARPSQLIMSAVDAVQIARKLIDVGDYEHASQILTKMPQTTDTPVEIERWYLIAQIFQRQGDYDNAIKIYRQLLDEQPDLSKIRYELALCYMAKEQWYRADYHLRLAMAGNNIPDAVKQQMMYYRYVARQNKRWNIWLNFGAAPDNNVNQASGGKDCVLYNGWILCNPLPEPDKAIGYNFSLGGNYEFILSDHWRLKNEANIYTNIYDKHKYDDLYLSFATGPRYIWNRGDIWLAGIALRRWYGWERYNWSSGAKLDTHYDWTRKLSTGLSLRFLNNIYDYYGDYMDGQSYGVAPYTTYSIDSTKYMVLRGGVDRDVAKNKAYTNWRYSTGIGFGAEIPWGFNIYFEPSFSWLKYDGARYVAENLVYQPIIERDFMQHYMFSISNNKFDFHGFVPTLTISYSKRNSNIHSREYDKWATEFTMRQRF